MVAAAAVEVVEVVVEGAFNSIDDDIDGSMDGGWKRLRGVVGTVVVRAGDDSMKDEDNRSDDEDDDGGGPIWLDDVEVA